MRARAHAASAGWLIVADDLTGAADCAIAFGRRGRAAAVSWGEGPNAPEHHLPIMAYDAASRGLAAEAAAMRHADILARLHRPEHRLFKKIDSTLRGQPAAETAAMLAHLRSRSGPALGICAPAFPATGRITRNGRILVKGCALEQTEVWLRDHTYPNSDLVAVLAAAGVRANMVGLADIRSGALEAKFAALADDGDIIAVCDAETEHDLRVIAQASLNIASPTFFVGSAGLAHALASLEANQIVAPLAIPPSTSGTLIVVGSLAGASRAAARALQATGTVAHVPVAPELLLDSSANRAGLVADLTQRLAGGGDALVEITMTGQPDMALGSRLAHGLAEMLQPVAPVLGAFAATGGETAAAILSRFGVNGIRLSDEIEPGVSLGLTLGRLSIPVATKAGAFGDEHSLIRISERLRAIRTKGRFS